MKLAALALLAFAVLLPGQESPWPFGAGGAKRDLYHAGFLGFKASDAVNGEPRSDGASGRRQVQVAPDDGKDFGPEILRVEMLLPGGPAEEAGLAVGDEVVGLGRRNFKDGCFEPLAKALAKALKAKEDTTIELKVRREGEKGTETLAISLPTLGKEFSKPTSREARALVGERALDWLAEKQGSDGGFAQTLSGVNGAVVQTAVAGLAWIAGGSDLAGGEHSTNLASALEFLRKNLGNLSGRSPSESGANWDQSNWGWAHAGLFFGELWTQSPEGELRSALQEDLQRVTTALFAGQEEGGGWAHGPGGPNALGYVELNIVAGLALGALGLAQRAGVELDEDALDRAYDYVERSSSGGGVGYSTREGQVGQGNIGRTAAMWLAYRALDRDREAKAFGNFVKRNAGEVLGGHASLMQHILLAGVAANAQGGGAAKNFWSTLERDYLLAMSSDGSFQPRPWRESLSMASNSDVSFGQVWTTASWALVCLSEGLEGWK